MTDTVGQPVNGYRRGGLRRVERAELGQPAVGDNDVGVVGDRRTVIRTRCERDRGAAITGRDRQVRRRRRAARRSCSNIADTRPAAVERTQLDQIGNTIGQIGDRHRPTSHRRVKGHPRTRGRLVQPGQLVLVVGHRVAVVARRGELDCQLPGTRHHRLDDRRGRRAHDDLAVLGHPTGTTPVERTQLDIVGRCVGEPVDDDR